MNPIYEAILIQYQQHAITFDQFLKLMHAVMKLDDTDLSIGE